MTFAISERILDINRNCWRIERADRLALIIDAADYFRAVKAAILEARHCVYLIGWDFDTRIKFEPEHQTLDGPNKLGPFLRWIDKNRPDVEVYVLKWDLGAIHALGRGTTPLAVLNWVTSARIHFKLDGAHPKAAAHHQKIVVVDDTLAFCGGIDMTADRWDTREHLDDDPHRKRPNGRSYGPWHDASTMVDGDVARALGELARERWRRASGRALEPSPPRPPIWPHGIVPTFMGIDVAIARTQPEYDGEEEVREIEAFYLDAIASAKQAIYWESQYFASRRIASAIAERLQERDGPEIVIVNPESADGFLEAVTMDTARARLLELINKADRYRRFRIYTPVTKNRQPIYVHAKILIVDDRLLRVKSSRPGDAFRRMVRSGVGRMGPFLGVGRKSSWRTQTLPLDDGRRLPVHSGTSPAPGHVHGPEATDHLACHRYRPILTAAASLLEGRKSAEAFRFLLQEEDQPTGAPVDLPACASRGGLRKGA
jgi:phospholipase D1/2